jgi:hypothetical protein
MTLKQYYVSMITEAMMKEDEKAVKYYEKELADLIKKEYEETIQKTKKASK